MGTFWCLGWTQAKGEGRLREPIDGPRDIVTELEYQDANGERLSVSSRIPLWPAKLHLGIRADRWVVVKGTVGFQTVVLDLAGKPVADRKVAVELPSKTTYSHRRRLVGDFYAYENKTETQRIAGGCEGETDEHRRARRCSRIQRGKIGMAPLGSLSPR